MFYRLQRHKHEQFQYKMESAERPQEFLLQNSLLKAVLDASCILPYDSMALINTVVMI